jgi:hypothetical protein
MVMQFLLCRHQTKIFSLRMRMHVQESAKSMAHAYSLSLALWSRPEAGYLLNVPEYEYFLLHML